MKDRGGVHVFFMIINIIIKILIQTYYKQTKKMLEKVRNELTYAKKDIYIEPCKSFTFNGFLMSSGS